MGYLGGVVPSVGFSNTPHWAQLKLILWWGLRVFLGSGVAGVSTDTVIYPPFDPGELRAERAKEIRVF